MKAVIMLIVAAMLQSAAPGGPRTVDRGMQSYVDEARQVVVRTPAEWKKLWQAHAPDRPAPAVNFATEMVVGVFAGSRPTSGYDIEIVGTTKTTGGAVVVQYKETQPPRDAMTAQVLTMPFHLVAIAKQAGDVRFEKAGK